MYLALCSLTNKHFVGTQQQGSRLHTTCNILCQKAATPWGMYGSHHIYMITPTFTSWVAPAFKSDTHIYKVQMEQINTKDMGDIKTLIKTLWLKITKLCNKIMTWIQYTQTLRGKKRKKGNSKVALMKRCISTQPWMRQDKHRSGGLVAGGSCLLGSAPRKPKYLPSGASPSVSDNYDDDLPAAALMLGSALCLPCQPAHQSALLSLP